MISPPSLLVIRASRSPAARSAPRHKKIPQPNGCGISYARFSTHSGRSGDLQSLLDLGDDVLADGDGSMRNLLGGKGANLAEMCKLNIPVPAGFTITTDCCTEFYKLGGQYPEALKAEVDAAAVYVNASTRFTDGGEFGFGAEIGISTQKLHARGPLGIAHMVSSKYIISGNGQIR